MNILPQDMPTLPSGIELIDTHCHLDMRGYDNLHEVIDFSSRAGVKRIITVGTDLASSTRAVEISEMFDGVFATIGVHPHSSATVTGETYDEMRELYDIHSDRIVGYGEIGLDYVKKYSSRDVQLKEFYNQIALAADLNLPLIVHDRDAHEDTLRILSQNKPYNAGGVMHCFSGDQEFARQIIDLGFHISIPGIVTFPKSEILQQVVRDIPLDHIILETDGPFLAPVPFRGKINTPGYLIFTARKIAEIKNITIDEVAMHTTLNAEKLFKLPSTHKTIH